MGKSSTTAVAVLTAAAVTIAGFGFAPAQAAPARKSVPDLSSGTVDAGAQRRYYRGRGYRGVPPAVPWALGTFAATAATIAAANAARRNYYYAPAPYGYYAPPPAYGYYGPGYAPYGYYDRW
ncbi:hypothetical protein PQJ75_10260 [Rhodoplanes sp. TEM]|uniref:Transmembrane protein n=1 Tax=Rhodoplanes tepidamans TaxID=200616 RepID=A0ABT5JID0_RHOTP|nr:MULTISPECIES: hypothetical protein [Rhodoplanes]MDC7788780.1 hypothetical protein [Rhodoplanes tepidamans]MDC7984112.1 hypothetical protein [Rhodoplanes sp. TEM]MDQ0356908.1 hypothetical protein [Rhodoplanes tepidamans]